MRPLPEKAFEGFQPPQPWLAPSPGQLQEWIRAIQGGVPNLCPFQYGTQLTEIGLLGNVAHRVGQPLEWDAPRMRARNCRAADTYLQHDYRPGWSL